jgi:Ni/Co efflux regulator RcnB
MMQSIKNGSVISDWSDSCYSPLDNPFVLSKKKDKDKKGSKHDKPKKKECCEKWKKGKRCKNCPFG